MTQGTRCAKFNSERTVFCEFEVRHNGPCSWESHIRAQAGPRPSSAPAVWDLVVADMVHRDQWGKEKYGTRLLAHNGRDAISDAYQEALDLCVYLRQAIYERDGK
jgi:hypothetical protein